MHIGHPGHALIAIASLAALPALADTTLPGTFCTADGPAERSVTGLVANKATPLAATTQFHCPIIRTQGLSAYGGTLSVSINVKTNPSTTEFSCFMRSVTANNMTHDSSKVVFASSAFNNGWAMGTFSVSLPVMAHAAVNMRCNVPNVVGGVEAGIVSYRINQ